MSEDSIAAGARTGGDGSGTVKLVEDVAPPETCEALQVGVAPPPDQDDIDMRSEDDEECNAKSPTESEWKLLQSRNLYLERQNYLLQKMIDLQIDYRQEMAQIASSKGYKLQKQVKNSPSFDFLPDLAIRQILKYVPPAHKRKGNGFLSCRLVCVRWNEIIENSCELMKKIAFPVWNPRLFLNLPIVQKRKVKSISFKCPLQLESEYTSNFMEAISNTVEKVTFEFEHTCYDKNELFNLGLKRCKNLQELIIQGFSIRSAQFYGPHELLRNITDTTQIAAVNNLQVLSINVDGLTLPDITGFIKLMSKLPQLKELNILPSCPIAKHFVIILNPLHEYLKNSEVSTELKKLSFGVNIDGISCSPFPLEHHQTLISLLILCGRRGIVVEGIPTISFNFLLAMVSPSIHQILPPPSSPLRKHHSAALFPTTLNGVLTFEDIPLRNLHRMDLLNVDYLNLQFKREIFKGELSWVKNINSVKHLCMEIDNEEEGGAAGLHRLGAASIREFEDAFSAGGLPSLETLEIGDMFDSIRVFQWARFFPNLKCLTICGSESAPDYLIVELSGLESLTTLMFSSLSNLNDAAFTTECVNRFAGVNRSPEIAPAICCFKQLKGLSILGCPLLTDDCIVNGIAKCETLKNLYIYGGCEGITAKKCHELVNCKVYHIDSEKGGESDVDSE